MRCRTLQSHSGFQVKVGKSRKLAVQDNSVLARVDDAITFRLLQR